MRKIITVGNIRTPITAEEAEICAAAVSKLNLTGPEIVSAKLHKRSIDARKRGGGKPEFVCSVRIECEIGEKKLEKLKRADGVSFIESRPIKPEIGNTPLLSRPLVVGFGPCGMFAALLLAEYGYAPVVVERGAGIAQRVEAVERFNRFGILDSETNIQFGAGGAGTFSDGKLVTRINDPVCEYVLNRFHEFGAPEEILYLAKPHIGTDRLLGVVDNIYKRITELGGEVMFSTKLTDIKHNDRKVTSAVLENNGQKIEMPVGAVILAIGHSARDSFEMLATKNLELLPKPFSVGVRVEHLQRDIDEALYGDYADICGKNGSRLLPHGEYSLSYRQPDNSLTSETARGVYSFCMCPGGEVVAAASEEGGVVTNGMSRYLRDGANANSAIAVSLFPEDIGGWREGIEFQRMLERRAFIAGGSNYNAPVETLGDYLSGKSSHFSEPKRIIPTYRQGKYTLCDLSEILPPTVDSMLKVGFSRFGKQIRGFDCPDAVLTGVETRTSSPVRIKRTDERVSTGLSNLYPCGEGAGYAGGITSAAVDGIKTALALMKLYKPFGQ